MFYEIDRKSIPLPLQRRVGKWCILAFARFHPRFGWGRVEVGFAAQFFMILSKMVAPWGVPII